VLALVLVLDCTSVTALDLSVGWAAARREIQKLPVRHEFSRGTLDVASIRLAVANAGRNHLTREIRRDPHPG
jgi:hypothetical protein